MLPVHLNVRTEILNEAKSTRKIHSLFWKGALVVPPQEEVPNATEAPVEAGKRRPVVESCALGKMWRQTENGSYTNTVLQRSFFFFGLWFSYYVGKRLPKTTCWRVLIHDDTCFLAFDMSLDCFNAFFRSWVLVWLEVFLTIHDTCEFQKLFRGWFVVQSYPCGHHKGFSSHVELTMSSDGSKRQALIVWAANDFFVGSSSNLGFTTPVEKTNSIQNTSSSLELDEVLAAYPVNWILA